MIIQNILFKVHLDDNEKIFYIGHRHVFTILKKLNKTLFLGMALPAFFYFMFPPLKILWIIWFCIGNINLIYLIADWYFDAWLITNMGIIDVEWNGFFDKTSTRVEYNALKGVSYSVRGVWGTILNFGDIYLEVFVSNSIVSLEKAAKPKKLERAILKNHDTYLTNKALSEHESLKTLLTSFLEKESAKK